MGISISIDDFGTGYSSLSYLQQFDVDIIKLDRSLVVNIVVTRSAQRIIDAVVRLGHDLDLEIVAEGVETLEQLHTLHDLDCDAVQGFLTGKPSADAVAQSWLDAPEEFPLSRLD
jgi:EAL domain-containing protein (putative c-di-GMP-specific phosphodiesterase class I)